jgi:hypothetical protein
MKTFIVLSLLFTLSAIVSGQPMVRIYGCVTDFDGTPLDGVQIRVMNSKFNPVVETISDDLGHYEVQVPEGRYMALVAVRDSEYRSSRLEYWAWNILARNDLEIDPRYDRMEIYAMNAFRPQGGYPSYMVYFRPMSLSMLQEGVQEDSTFLAQSVIDIAPRLTDGDMSITINDQQVRILSISRVKESGGPSSLYGYLIQCELPQEPSSDSYDRIRIIATDPISGDMGEGLLYVEKLW